ncbi:MAG TPA: hypothetical protein H9825_10950, partial [Candidatus Sphingobacterium stercorigallinarum]|nr:hypothetical protein [Candidatus Sphingobacterium stercorigallinarum]
LGKQMANNTPHNNNRYQLFLLMYFTLISIATWPTFIYYTLLQGSELILKSTKMHKSLIHRC